MTEEPTSRWGGSPKELGDLSVRRGRHAMLEAAHIQPLTRFVERLRGARDLTREIPFFDPLDGGTRARCLIVAEAPGPGAVRSGFISRENPDESAKNTLLAHAAAGLPREQVVLWNIVPWYIGDGQRIRPAADSDIREGLNHLVELVTLIPSLEVVALVGRKAQRVRRDIERRFPALRVFDVPHPSPQFVNRDPDNWRILVDSLRDVAESLRESGKLPEPKLPPHMRRRIMDATPANRSSAAGGLESKDADELMAIVRDRGVVLPKDADRAKIISAIRALPRPIESRSMYAGKRIVRAKAYQSGGNPRQFMTHGYNAYELIPLGDYGIRFEDLIARIRALPTGDKGGPNHVKWDLDHGHTYLIDDGEMLPARNAHTPVAPEPAVAPTPMAEAEPAVPPTPTAAPELPEAAKLAAPASHRPYDSSLTRVAPVFDAISRTGANWARKLLHLPQGGSPHASVPAGLRLEVEACCWGEEERALDPPIGLLSWLIRNLPVPPRKSDDGAAAERRWRLFARDPDTIAEALRLLRSDSSPRGWHVLEGQTYPDAFIETPDALIVVEGKRTESGPTTSTTWMPLRHQMLRHIDAAWEIRGHRQVFGLFVVEAEEGSAAVPAHWSAAAQDTISPEAVAASLPHRSPEEREGIVNAFLGVTTWQAVCAEFGIDTANLPDRAPVADA